MYTCSKEFRIDTINTWRALCTGGMELVELELESGAKELLLEMSTGFVYGYMI